MTKATQEKSPRPPLLSHSSDSNRPPTTSHFPPQIFSTGVFVTFFNLSLARCCSGQVYCRANFLKQKICSNPGATFPPLFMESCRPFHGFAPLAAIQDFRRGGIAMEIGATFPACPGARCGFSSKNSEKALPTAVTFASPFSQWLPKMSSCAKG